MPVTQPSEWQKKYSRFSDQQLQLACSWHERKLAVSEVIK